MDVEYSRVLSLLEYFLFYEVFSIFYSREFSIPECTLFYYIVILLGSLLSTGSGSVDSCLG